MLPPLKKISTKIIGMLVIFFLVATAAISMTLAISWQLEGGAAAINDAGSERMRAYRIGYLMAQGSEGQVEMASVESAIRDEVQRFDKLLADIGQGDPARPLAPPRNAEVKERLEALRTLWQGTMEPLVMNFLVAPDSEKRAGAFQGYRSELEGFVRGINGLVVAMEQNYAYNTNLLRTFQIVLVVLAVFGTALLIRFFFLLVIRPVEILHDGLQRMTGDDLSVRLPVGQEDEFGVLAQGFNHMAEHLQAVYGTLEERVAVKTSSLAERNRDLGVLYDATTFLNEPSSMDQLCEGFLTRIREAMGADAGAVRLFSPGTEELILMTHHGLSERFVANEVALRCGDCLCTDVMYGAQPVAFEVKAPPRGMRLHTCEREGFSTATAFPITHNKQRLGIYNLYFWSSRPVSEQEKDLLETLGQHLGVAVENLRLRSREREMAVSEERNLLAQELHDSIAQGLAFLNIQAQLLQDSLNKRNIVEAEGTVGQLRAGIQESYDDVRELLVHFRTRMHQTDLDSALSAILEKFSSQTGVQAALERSGSGLPLSPEDQIQVMHIVQESLSNVRKHARASTVRVIVLRNLEGINIEVVDDGVGFDPETDPAVFSDRHVGLKIMKERAHRVGGQCQVTSTVGQGSRVTLWLPRLKREAA